MAMQEKCALCGCAIRDEDRIVVSQGGIFHAPCWLRVESRTHPGRNDAICPVCQRAILPDELIVDHQTHVKHEACSRGPTPSKAEN